MHEQPLDMPPVLLLAPNRQPGCRSLYTAAKPSPKERRKAPLDQTAPPLDHHQRDFISTNVQEAAAAAPRYQEQEEVRTAAGQRVGGICRVVGAAPHHVACGPQCATTAP